ncbi:hypothetical protein BaRGS_00025642, partial [Batillaria attramentaria]
MPLLTLNLKKDGVSRICVATGSILQRTGDLLNKRAIRQNVGRPPQQACHTTE